MKLSGNVQRESRSGLEPSIEWLLPPLAAVSPCRSKKTTRRVQFHVAATVFELKRVAIMVPSGIVVQLDDSPPPKGSASELLDTPRDTP
jgi:hypothetical protein